MWYFVALELFPRDLAVEQRRETKGEACCWESQNATVEHRRCQHATAVPVDLALSAVKQIAK